MTTGKCKYCYATIYKVVGAIGSEWVHPEGNVYCQDDRGITATPIRKAQPALETETL